MMRRILLTVLCAMIGARVALSGWGPTLIAAGAILGLVVPVELWRIRQWGRAVRIFRDLQRIEREGCGDGEEKEGQG